MDANSSDAESQRMHAEIARVREILPDIDTRHVGRRLSEAQRRNENLSTAAENLITDCLEEDGYPRDLPLSAQDTAAVLKFDWCAEVQDHWAAELRGDAPESIAGEQNKRQKSQNYNLHAMHTLLGSFPKVPVPALRQVFLKSGTFSAAAQHLKEQGVEKELKKARSQKEPPPCEVPCDLAREVAMEPYRSLIDQELELHRSERKRKINQCTSFYTCGCCFDETVLPEEVVLCSSDALHAFCLPCVKNLAVTTFGAGLFAQNYFEAARASASSSSSSSSSSSGAYALVPMLRRLAASTTASSLLPSSSTAPPSVGSRTLDLQLATVKCPDLSGCAGCFSERALREALPPKIFRRYTSRSAALQALASGLHNLVPCPGCEFIVEMSDPTNGVLKCLSAGCGRVSCRWCGEPPHPGLRCDEKESSETKLRTFIEEQMTNAATRRCPNPKCRKAYERSEGCNKMTCPCGTFFCFLCSEVLDKTRPYDHYKDGHLGGGVGSAESRCMLYGEPAWAQKSERAVKEHAEASLQEYLEAHPELQGLGGAKLLSIRRQAGLGDGADVPIPARKSKRRRVEPIQAAPRRAPAWKWNQCSIQ